MRICWDNIENIRLTKNGNFRDIKRNIIYYLNVCKVCGEEFLGLNKNGFMCSTSCSNKNRKVSKDTKNKISLILKGRKSSQKNIKFSEDLRRKISINHANVKGKNNPMYGKHHTEETKKKISMYRLGKKDVYTVNKIPKFKLYSSQLEWAEEVRRNPEDNNILEVKCTYCGKWFIPSTVSVRNRLNSLNGIKGYKGEHHFYCSKECKYECPLYHKKPETLMKEDAIRAGNLQWLELNREVQPELRQMVFKRDGYKCVKCNSNGPLHCHHILPVATNPIESADIDNCITLCYSCHKEVHEQDGCKYKDLKMKIC